MVVLIAALRRLGTGWLPRSLILLGATSLAIAAGQPMWNRKSNPTITVMVDLSPSTRGATFRNRAPLDLRISQLLGNLPHQTIAFSDHNQPLPPGDALADLRADQTLFQPPVTDAVLLFSDGQFPLPSDAPPTFPVIDPALNHPADAAVTDLKSVGHHVLAAIRNEDPARALTWTGAVADINQPQLATPTGATQISATLPPGDLWPENDSLSLNLPPPDVAQNWWVGSAPPAGWRGFSTASLPENSADFLLPSIIVLNNIPADALSSSQQQHLLQYTQDLGGALLIAGGDHAFAAGNYDGTPLEHLSPLSSSPPLPTQKWFLLIDASGSMAGNPWQAEIAAVSRLIPQLPPRDPVTVASFARSLSLWPTTTVPPDVFPTGPTNLAPALQQITDATDSSLPTHILLMTDADTDLPNPTQLATELTAKKIRLHLLAIGNGSALPALKFIASATGGSVLEQLDPQQWFSTARLLLRSALPNHLQHKTISITPSPPSTITDWNQTWLKPSAFALQQSGPTPLSARWQSGLGQVIAMAYPADPNIILSFAKQIAAPPRDPRFKVTWDAGASLQVTVNAADGNQYLNGQSLSLETDHVITPLPQTAPGEYQVTLPGSRVSKIVTVKNQKRILERFAVAGRYPSEFDAIGNNLQNLQTLADHTGGAVIPPGPVHPIDFHWPLRQTPLLSEFAFAGFLAIAAGMLWNKRF